MAISKAFIADYPIKTGLATTNTGIQKPHRNFYLDGACNWYSAIPFAIFHLAPYPTPGTVLTQRRRTVNTKANPFAFYSFHPIRFVGTVIIQRNVWSLYGPVPMPNHWLCLMRSVGTVQTEGTHGQIGGKSFAPLIINIGVLFKVFRNININW